MNWWRRLLPLRSSEDAREVFELVRTRTKHRKVIEKADRVIDEYAKLDGALQLYVRRK